MPPVEVAAAFSDTVVDAIYAAQLAIDSGLPRFAIQSVINTVDKLNRADKSGRRRVRIHAVGFPVLFGQGQGLSVNVRRYAALMRKLAMALWHVARGEAFDSRKLFNAQALGLAA